MEGDNEIWQIGSGKLKKNLGGRPPRFGTPEELLQEMMDYLNYMDTHGWEKKGASQGLTDDGDRKRNTIRQDVKAMKRPYTLYGFCAYAVIPKWADFKAAYLSKPGFSEVILWFEEVVLTQQVEGAIIREFESNIISRLNGLADKQINEIASGGKMRIIVGDEFDEREENTD